MSGKESIPYPVEEVAVGSSPQGLYEIVCPFNLAKGNPVGRMSYDGLCVDEPFQT